MEAYIENTALPEGTEGNTFSARSDKKPREKVAGLTEEGILFQKNDVSDGWPGETENCVQLFQPQISASLKKIIADN